MRIWGMIERYASMRISVWTIHGNPLVTKTALKRIVLASPSENKIKANIALTS